MAAAALAVAVCVSARPAPAESASAEVWLISTRCAPRSGRVDTGLGQIEYWRLGADNRWLAADADAFRETGEPAVPTTFVIHGNRQTHAKAIRSGWGVYCRMRRDAGGRPFRLVIWSWPSERIRGTNRRDVRVKACRSDMQSCYLAECLSRLDPDLPVCLVGYSFGARIVTGALHLLAGGQVAGRALGEPSGVGRRPIRAVLVAGALDADWLLPGRRNGLALSQVERLLVTRNCRDPALRLYPLMYYLGGPQALGFAGPACCGQSEKIELLDVSCSVGRTHAWARYLQSPGLCGRLAWYTFLGDLQAEVNNRPFSEGDGPVFAARESGQSPSLAGASRR